MNKQDFYDTVLRHDVVAEKLRNAVNRYAGRVHDAYVLEGALGPEHSVTQEAGLGLGHDRRRAADDLNVALLRGTGRLLGACVLAASPGFAGPATVAYRVVLLKLADGSFSVHRSYLDDLGGLDDGNYFNAYADALDRWLKRTAYEVEHRGPQCHHPEPL